MRKILLMIFILSLLPLTIAAGDNWKLYFSDGITTINGTDVCVNDGTCLSDTSGAAGDITAVNTAGNYLTGGAVSGVVNLLLNGSRLNDTIDSRAGGDNESWNETYGRELFRLDSWNNFTGIPHATPSDSDITHFSLADEIYDWVIGLAYATTTYVDNLIATYTHLSNFTNDLGISNYSHLTNFTDDLGDRGYTSTLNFSNDLSWINTSGEIDSLSLHLSQDNWYNDSNGYMNWDRDSLEFNETKLNISIRAIDTATNTSMKAYVDDQDNDTTYTNGSAINLTGTEFSLSICGDNEIWKMDGSSWNCEADDGTTDTNASTACSTTEVLLGNGTCLDSDNFYDDTDTTIGNCSADQSCANVLYTTDEYLGGLSCADKKIAKWNDTSNIWYCSDDEVGEPGAGDIEGVLTTGNILYGGCTTGTCNIFVNGTLLNNSMDARDSNTNCSIDVSCDPITYDSELSYTTDTNASISCGDGTYLNGNGTCVAGYLDADGIDADSGGDGNASSICAGDDNYLSGEGNCNEVIDTDTNLTEADVDGYCDDNGYSNDTWVDSLFVRFTEIVAQVGNWTLDKVNYYTSSTIDTLISSIGNWTADKSDYSTTTEAGALYSTIDEPLWTANYTANNASWSLDTDTNLTEDAVEAYIFDDDNTANITLGNYCLVNQTGGGSICHNGTGWLIIG